MVSNDLVMKLLQLASQVLPAEDAEPAYGKLGYATPQKALIVPSMFIGDNLLLLPFIRNLRASMPRPAELDILASPATRHLFYSIPELDGVFLEKTPAVKPPHRFLMDQQYDTIFFCRYSLYWGSAARRAQVAQRIGYDLNRWGIDALPRWGKCLTHTVPSRSIFDARHQVELYLDMLRQLGLPVFDSRLLWEITPTESAAIEPWVKQAGQHPKILIHAAAGSPGKRWDKKNWVQLIQGLDQILDPTFFIVGSKKETVHYRHWQPRNPMINLCGQTTLHESIALLSQMDLVITLDTSVAHMAALAGTPRVVVLYGPTNEKQWRPIVQPDTVLKQLFVELPCRPCIMRTCEHKSCMRKLGPDQVLAAALDSFAQKPL